MTLNTTSDANTKWSYSTLDQVPSETSVVLDPDGDLHLRAATTTFKICSAALRRTSPVWKAMLFGPWKELKPNRNGEEQWLIELPEDPPVALHIAATIAHGQIAALPNRILIPTFADLLIFTDKYDMREVIRPFIPRWVDELGWNKVHVGSVEHVQAANIMWELGLVEELNSLMNKVVFEADREALETLSSSTEASADVSRFIGEDPFPKRLTFPPPFTFILISSPFALELTESRQNGRWHSEPSSSKTIWTSTERNTSREFGAVATRDPTRDSATSQSSERWRARWTRQDNVPRSLPETILEASMISQSS
jgi:hypothetical protein